MPVNAQLVFVIVGVPPLAVTVLDISLATTLLTEGRQSPGRDPGWRLAQGHDQHCPLASLGMKQPSSQCCGSCAGTPFKIQMATGSLHLPEQSDLSHVTLA